jgi:hypothetical protein
MKVLLLLAIIFLFCNMLIAQEDSTRVLDSNNNFQKKWFDSHYVHESIVPLGLALGSVVVIAIPNLKEQLQRRLTWDDDLKPGYVSLGDDYIRYTPAVAAYALSALGLKSKHRFIDRSVILAVSYIASDFVVYHTKNITKSLRPGRPVGNTDYSFPSQHAAMAFVAASFLDHELGYISPWISAGGYLTASYVGYARVARNRHWISDVLMGAAVGIIMTNATYWAYDGVMKIFPKNLTVLPIIDSKQTGLNLCYSF